MNKRIISLFLALLLIVPISGCDSNENAPVSSINTSKAETTADSEKDTDISVVDSETDSNEISSFADEVMEKFGYNGTFNDEVFERMLSSIVIGDTEVSHPCCLNDFNEDYEYDGRYPTTMTYKGYPAVKLYLKDDGDGDVNNDVFTSLHFARDIINDAEMDNFFFDESFGGIKLDDTPDVVEKYLGKPSKTKKTTSGGIWYFYKSDKYELHVDFDYNNKLFMLDAYIIRE